MDVASPENCPFTVSELIETEQRVIAHALEMTVVGCFFLIAVHRTLRTVNVQNHPLMDSAGHSSFYPPGIKQGKSLEVILLSKQFGLKPTHLACAGGISLRTLPSHQDSHSWVLGKAVGIIGVVVSCEAAVNGLSQQRD